MGVNPWLSRRGRLWLLRVCDLGAPRAKTVQGVLYDLGRVSPRVAIGLTLELQSL